MAPGDLSLVDRDHLHQADVADVRELLESATEHDGVRPLSEHVWLHVAHGGDERALHVLARNDDGTLIGYAHLDTTDEVEGPSGELVVHPSFRRHGAGRALITHLIERSSGPLRLWAHGEHVAASRLAEDLGFERHRTLWQMRRSLHSALPEPRLPEGVVLRSFNRDRDEEAFLRVNARAFADLPDQGSWTLTDLHRREQEAWFDPNGFLMAWAADDEPNDNDDEVLAGFHWTKVHGASSHDDHSHQAIGEVYVLAVDPAWRGSGLGRALTLAGLHHLRRLGLDQVMLYVDAANVSAIELYEGLGFMRWDTDVMYRKRSDS